MSSGGQRQLWPAEFGGFHATDGQQDGREGHQRGDHEGFIIKNHSHSEREK